MRLLIYLLAMMTGFSAAEAACPVAAAPAAVAQGAFIAATVAAPELKIASTSLQQRPELAVAASAPVNATPSIGSSSPVLRHDVTRH